MLGGTIGAKVRVDAVHHELTKGVWTTVGLTHVEACVASNFGMFRSVRLGEIWRVIVELEITIFFE